MPRLKGEHFLSCWGAPNYIKNLGAPNPKEKQKGPPQTSPIPRPNHNTQKKKFQVCFIVGLNNLPPNCLYKNKHRTPIQGSGGLYLY